MDRKPQLNDDDFERFRDLILARTGMMFGPRRRDALTRGVLQAAQRAGRANPQEYYRLLLQARTDSELWDDLIGAITVGETYFFRNPSHFDALRQHILPDLIARHRHDRRLRIWSAGCSTGEEPYSVAILLHQLLPNIAQWNVLILATDINKRALRQAGEGRYRKWSFRKTDPAIQTRYFTQQSGHFELSRRVRKMVTFAYLNLAEDAYPALATNTNALDLILYRNVAIYLPEKVIQRIATRFHRCLLPEGWLVVGASETSSAIYSQFATRNFPGAIVYQKTSAVADKGTRRPGEKEITPRPRVTPSPSLPVTASPHPEPKAKEPAELCQEGVSLLEQGRYEEATARFQACLKGDPDFALAHYQMARAHANQGQLEEARSWCQQAIERDPLLTEAYYTLALIRQEEGELVEAIAQLKKTLYLDPGFVLAHFTLANLYQEAGRSEQAARHRTQTVRLAAKMPPDDVVPGSDGLAVGRLLTMVKATL